MICIPMVIAIIIPSIKNITSLFGLKIIVGKAKIEKKPTIFSLFVIFLNLKRLITIAREKNPRRPLILKARLWFASPKTVIAKAEKPKKE